MPKRFADIRVIGIGLVACMALLLFAGPRLAAAQSATPADTAKAAATTKPAKAPKVAKPRKERAPEPSFEEAKALDGLWAKRTNWISLRAGYAKRTGPHSGDGLGGYGIAWQRMMSRRTAFGVAVHHEILGHLNRSTEISVPFTAEFTRQIKWNTALRPYVGIGGGYYFHKYYRSGPDYGGSPRAGWFVNFGANAPIEAHRLLGVDARVSFLPGRTGVVNPVFGQERTTETEWSIKLNWALAY